MSSITRVFNNECFKIFFRTGFWRGNPIIDSEWPFTQLDATSDQNRSQAQCLFLKFFSSKFMHFAYKPIAILNFDLATKVEVIFQN